MFTGKEIREEFKMSTTLIKCKCSRNTHQHKKGIPLSMIKIRDERGKDEARLVYTTR